MVDLHYGSMPKLPKKESDYLTVRTSFPTAGSALSITQKRTEHLLPLLLYFQWNDIYRSQLNTQIPVINFTNSAVKYANSKNLKQLLNGQRLELTIDSIPSALETVDKEKIYLLTLILSKVYMQPVKKDLVVRYRILNDQTETKSGVVNIADITPSIGIGQFNNPKKKMSQYLDNYAFIITAMSKQVIDTVIAAL